MPTLKAIITQTKAKYEAELADRKVPYHRAKYLHNSIEECEWLHRLVSVQEGVMEALKAAGFDARWSTSTQPFEKAHDKFSHRIITVYKDGEFDFNVEWGKVCKDGYDQTGVKYLTVSLGWDRRAAMKGKNALDAAKITEKITAFAQQRKADKERDRKREEEKEKGSARQAELNALASELGVSVWIEKSGYYSSDSFHLKNMSGDKVEKIIRFLATLKD